jgi:uncharacterized protein YjbJ (UPF0337 family)
MNWDRVEGNWKQVKGKVKQKWGKLTDDQIDVIAGHREQLIGKIQESYGIAKDEAERQVKDWETTFEKEFDKYTSRKDSKRPA